jgi:hypothetical protein
MLPVTGARVTKIVGARVTKSSGLVSPKKVKINKKETGTERDSIDRSKKSEL